MQPVCKHRMVYNLTKEGALFYLTRLSNFCCIKLLFINHVVSLSICQFKKERKKSTTSQGYVKKSYRSRAPKKIYKAYINRERNKLQGCHMKLSRDTFGGF